MPMTSPTSLDLIHDRIVRARTKLDEAIAMAKEDRQHALLELLVIARKELS